MQIELLGIFDKFSKIPLMEVVATGWTTAAVVDGGGRW